MGHSQTLVFYPLHLPWHFLEWCTPPSLSFYCVGSTTKNSFWHLLQTQSMATEQNRDEDINMYGADFNTFPCTQQPTFSFPLFLLPFFLSFLPSLGLVSCGFWHSFCGFSLGGPHLPSLVIIAHLWIETNSFFGGCVRTVAFGPWPWFGLNQHLFIFNLLWGLDFWWGRSVSQWVSNI